LDVNSALTVTNAQSWGGSFDFVGSNALTLSGALTLTAADTVTVSAGTLTSSGVIGGAFNLTKQGPGLWLLSGSNLYTGGTLIAGGTLGVTTGSALGTGTVTLSGGDLMLESDAGLNLTNTMEIAADTAMIVKRRTMGAGTVDSFADVNIEDTVTTITVETDSTVTGSAALNFGATTLSDNVTFNVGALAALTVGAVGESGGSFGLTKTGAGSLILSAASTYDGGTVVTAGTLVLNGSTAAGSAMAVNSGGTLSGTGTVSGAITVAGGGTLAPTPGPAPLTLGGNVTLNGGSALTFGLSATAQGQLIIVGTGAGTLAGPATGTVTINLLDLNGSVAANTTYTLVSVVGGFSSVSDWSLSSFTLNAPSEWGLSQLSMSGDNLVVLVIPEPAAVALLTALPVLTLVVRRRRRHGSRVRGAGSFSPAPRSRAPGRG
jgi:autotransporter-associated beta strand protein